MPSEGCTNAKWYSSWRSTSRCGKKTICLKSSPGHKSNNSCTRRPGSCGIARSTSCILQPCAWPNKSTTCPTSAIPIPGLPSLRPNIILRHRTMSGNLSKSKSAGTMIGVCRVIVTKHPCCAPCSPCQGHRWSPIHTSQTCRPSGSHSRQSAACSSSCRVAASSTYWACLWWFSSASVQSIQSWTTGTWSRGANSPRTINSINTCMEDVAVDWIRLWIDSVCALIEIHIFGP